MKTVVLIPCYNEELTIKNVIEGFKCNMSNDEIYVYDNNSTDRTAEIATSLWDMSQQEFDRFLNMLNMIK